MKRVERYLLQSLVGQGAEGTLYFGVDEVSKHQVAVKELKRSSCEHVNEVVEKANRECRLLRMLKSSCLAEVLDLVSTSSAVYIVYKQYATDLSSYVSRLGSVSEWVVRNWGLQILKGLVDLHFFNVIHRDLKPANILLTENSDQSQAIITDFGMAAFLGPNPLDEMVGTLAFMAPEVTSGQPYNEKADVYSFGLVLLYLLGPQPFSRESVNEGATEVRDGISQEAQDLIRLCLTEDPKQRPSAYKLSRHPFFCLVKSEMLDTPLPGLERNANSVSMSREEMADSIIKHVYGQKPRLDAQYVEEYLTHIQTFFMALNYPLIFQVDYLKKCVALSALPDLRQQVAYLKERLEQMAPEQEQLCSRLIHEVNDLENWMSREEEPNRDQAAVLVESLLLKLETHRYDPEGELVGFLAFLKLLESYIRKRTVTKRLQALMAKY